VNLRSTSSHASGVENGGIPRVGSIAPRASESLYARFFERRDDLDLAGTLVSAPLATPPKNKTRPKPRNKKDGHQRLRRCDIFADRLECHFP
jgi:hypothetical protein